MQFVFLCDVKEKQDSNRIIVVNITDFKILLSFRSSVMSNCLQPHGLQHARLLYPYLSLRACSNSCPLIESVSSSHPILCHPFLLPSVFPSIRVFSNEPKKIKSVTVSTFSPSICHEVMEPDVMILVF